MDSPNEPGPSRAISSASSKSMLASKRGDEKKWDSTTDTLAPIETPLKNGENLKNSEETERDDEEVENIGEGATDFSSNYSVVGSSAAATKESAPAYEIFSLEQIALKMGDVIKEVQGIIPQPSETIRLLLNHFDWNKERLLDTYFEGDNADKLIADVETRIENSSGGESSSSALSSSADENKKTQIKNFVKSNPSFKWCPNPFCTKVIKIGRVNENEKDSYIKCACGHAFCFHCEAYAHAPVTCDLLRKWNTKRHLELESLTSHENESKKQEPRSLELKRFILYLRSYIDHAKLLKQERKLYERSIMDEQQDKSMSFMEIQFLKDAVDTVYQCRLAVMHTFIFEYYVEPSKETEKFSTNRNDLLAAVERLSGYLGGITNWDKLSKVKIDVQNLCTYSQSLRQVLIDSVHEGYSKAVEDGGWSLNEEE